MLEGPYHTVQACIELISRHVVELLEVVLDHRSEELKERLPNLGI